MFWELHFCWGRDQGREVWSEDCFGLGEEQTQGGWEVGEPLV